MIDRIFGLTYGLERGEIDEKGFLRTLLAETREAVGEGEFDPWLSMPMEQGNTYLGRCSGYAPGKSWRYQVYRIPEGTQHPPHGHHNLASFQLVVKGRLHVQEFQRLRRLSEDTLELEWATNRILGEGDAFVTTEFSNNVHWFQALGDVVSINFNLRGYAPRTFDKASDAKAGRRYVIPLASTLENGVLQGREVDKQAALAAIRKRPGGLLTHKGIQEG